MGFLIISTLVSFLLSGCASYHGGNGANSQKPSTSRTVKLKTTTPLPAKPIKEIKSGVVWEVLSDKSLTLQFTNVDTESYMTVVIEKGLSKRSFPVGHWELTGFEENGNSFLSMNTSKKFVFRSKEKSLNYGGTILVGCPSISKDSIGILKQMKFFNRYPFSGTSGICEVVIGDNFEAVLSELKKSQRSKKLSLIMGF